LDLREKKFPLTPDFRLRALQWAQKFPYACYLNGHDYSLPYGPFPEVLATGMDSENPDHIFSGPGRCYGFFGYEAKFSPGPFQASGHGPGFPDCVFFRASHEIRFLGDVVTVCSDSPDQVWEEISSAPVFLPQSLTSPSFRAETSQQEYLQKVEQILDLIREGWVYELNFCQFFEKAQAICGLSAWLKLDERMPMPFSGWLKFPGFEIASASPERFLKKEGNKLISQPIKGTAKRGKTPEEDALSKAALLQSEKERAENLMIVDLVRNDLSSVSQIGSVCVEELFGIYAYPSVFQMISTIVSTLDPRIGSLEAIAAAFPMGSMTGAPKKEVMRRIAALESRKRGPFSGAMGYADAGGNFDFNVLIRSVFTDHRAGKTFFAAGSAITIDALPGPEWEECGIKAGRIWEVFGEDWQDLFR